MLKTCLIVSIPISDSNLEIATRGSEPYTWPTRGISGLQADLVLFPSHISLLRSGAVARRVTARASDGDTAPNQREVRQPKSIGNATQESLVQTTEIDYVEAGVPEAPYMSLWFSQPNSVGFVAMFHIVGFSA